MGVTETGGGTRAMITANVNLGGLNRGVAGLINRVGLNNVVVLKKETGELIKTLVKMSPPEDPTKTRASIEKNIRSKFDSVADGGGRSFEETSGTMGASGIKWYSVDERFLRGVAPASDKRTASTDELYSLSQKISRKGRIISNFKYPHKRQRVMISQKIVVKKSQVNTLVARVKRHVGRLKAGWLVAVTDGRITLSGSNMPPSYVTRHAVGAQGAFVDELSNKSTPRFTIINRAKGIGQKKVDYLVRTAGAIRAKAIETNIALFLRGKKQLSDYSK